MTTTVPRPTATRRPPVGDVIRADLAAHPGATAGEIRKRTNLPIGSINDELARHSRGDNPKYAACGHLRKPGMSRAGQTWRLADDFRGAGERLVDDLLTTLRNLTAGQPALRERVFDEYRRWVAETLRPRAAPSRR